MNQIAGAGKINAHPVKFLMGNYKQPGIAPGSRNPGGQPGLWVNDTDFSGAIEWIDDTESGFSARTINAPGDAIGVIGLIAGQRYRIDDILQVGKNVVVYQFTNLESCEYLAYGFGRAHVDVRSAFSRYLEHSQAMKLDLDPEKMVSLANRVLAAFPDDEAANFNLGVAFMAEGKFTEAHPPLDKAVQVNGQDVLNLLYDGAALAGMNENSQAVNRLLAAESYGADATREALKTYSQVKELLGRSVSEMVNLHPQRADVGQLWLKYFSPSL